MSKSKFRILIFLHIALTVAGIAVSFIPNMYSPALALAYDNEPTTWLAIYDNEPIGWLTVSEWLVLAIGVPLLLLSILGIFGLYFFKQWGRTVSLYTTISFVLVAPFFGASVASSLESSLLDSASLIWGAILALAYYSPVSSFFVRVSRSGL